MNKTETKVVHCKRQRYDVYIGRPGIFGNPYKMHTEAERQHVLSEYEHYVNKRCAEDAVFCAQVRSLRGKTLACWCSPKQCHGDVLVAWLENDSATACN
jgi:hypothetical protein